MSVPCFVPADILLPAANIITADIVFSSRKHTITAIIMDMTAPHARKSVESSLTPKTSLTASAAVSANR